MPIRCRAALAAPRVQRPSAVAAFTLIEVLAAVLLTSIVLTVAVSIFINISNATASATASMRETRHAVSILDRIAHDLESAFLLVRPGETDPLDHPWVFFAEGTYSDGADRLKFIIRSHQTRSSVGHSADLAVVTYALVEDEFGSFDLVRSASRNLPERLDLQIPVDEDEGAMLLAEGIESFSVRFLAESGEWIGHWDSSQIVASGLLPLAAEIEIAFVDPEAAARDLDSPPLDFDEGEASFLYRRRVLMPMRPVAIGQIVAEYIEAVQSGEVSKDGRTSDRSNSRPSEEFEAGCQGTMSYLQCAERNVGRLVDALGREAAERCIVAQPNSCIGEVIDGRNFFPAKLCGVRVTCK